MSSSALTRSDPGLKIGFIVKQPEESWFQDEWRFAEMAGRKYGFNVLKIGGIDGDEIRLTNRAWSCSREELRTSLGLDELQLLNDFGAVAWAVTALRPDDRVALYGPVAEPLAGPISVLGPGTGLGVGFLLGAQPGSWRVVETEGGHVSFAPLDDEERAIAQWLTARHGRVSNERLLCGDGLSQVDALLRGAADAGLRHPADIVAAALGGTYSAASPAIAR